MRWAVLCLLWGGGVFAEDRKTELARIHVKAGIAYYDEARYEDAVREMEAAYELKAFADLQYNIAQCYERLNRLEQAAGAYEKYLVDAANPGDRRSIETRVANLRERAKAAAEGQAPPAPIVVEKEVLRTIVVYRVAPPPPGRGTRWAGYGAWGLGILALASGITFAVLGAQAASDLNSGGDVLSPPAFDGSYRTLEANARTYPIVSGVSFAVGAVGFVGGGLLYWFGNKIDRETPKEAP